MKTCKLIVVALSVAATVFAMNVAVLAQINTPGQDVRAAVTSSDDAQEKERSVAIRVRLLLLSAPVIVENSVAQEALPVYTRHVRDKLSAYERGVKEKLVSRDEAMAELVRKREAGELDAYWMLISKRCLASSRRHCLATTAVRPTIRSSRRTIASLLFVQIAGRGLSGALGCFVPRM